MKKNLYVVEIYRTSVDSKEICKLYCEGNDPVVVGVRVRAVLIANYNFKELDLNPESLYFRSYKVDEKDAKIIRKFCTVCEW